MKAPKTSETEESKGLSLRERWGEDLAKTVLVEVAVVNPGSIVKELIHDRPSGSQGYASGTGKS